MNRWWNLALAGILAWSALGVSAASAQQPLGGYTPPYAGPPAFSPFLNLNRAGTPPGINYFGLVQPQQQTAQQLANLQYQQNALAGTLGASGTLGADGALPPSTTGHGVRYFDYTRYFPINGLPAGSFGAGGLPGAGGAPAAGYGAPGVRQAFTPGVAPGITPGIGLFIR
jgi:hypothetical protein